VSQVIKLTKSGFLLKPHLRHNFFEFFFVFNFVWLTGPGIFGGNCPKGNFKGKYAGRVGRQD
jgi:hypothetical protein